MTNYGSGIQVTDVRLQVADPPVQVRDAFQEVVRAKADRERLINEAQAYQNDLVPRARGDKQRLIEEAQASRKSASSAQPATPTGSCRCSRPISSHPTSPASDCRSRPWKGF